MLKNNNTQVVAEAFPGSRLILFACLIAALAIRLLHLGSGFAGDESILYDISRLGIREILQTLAAKEVYPPLTYVLIHYWGLLNSSYAWIRLYFALFGIGVCALVFSIARDFLSEKASEIALLLSVFSPLLIYSSQYARSYGDSCFWMLLSVFFLLKIIKGKDKPLYWFGYFISCAAGIYTFYFSALLFFAQFIFMHIFYLRKKMILNYYITLSLVIFTFLPWVGAALRQFKNASSIAYDWSNIGFSISGLRFGLYARNILAVFGMDPYFMVYPGGIGRYFSRPALILSSGFCFLLILLIFIYSIKFLIKKFSASSPLVWFFPALIIIPIVSSWVCAGFLNTLPAVKYFSFFNAVFLVFVSVFICAISENRRWLGIALTFPVIAFYIGRIPQATAQEIEADKAISFLSITMPGGDAVVCARSCPGPLAGRRIIKLGSYLQLDENGQAYKELTQEASDEIKAGLSPFREVFFYKAYGNAEIFGANRIVEGSLSYAGFKEASVEKFRNIDVVRYEK